MTTGKTIGECQACGFSTMLTRYEPVYPENSAKMICELCASTMNGRCLEYQERNLVSNADILQAVCYIGNALLKEIQLARKTLAKK